MGIEPARIEAAARSLDAADSDIKRTAGIPTTFQLTRFVAVELEEGDLPKMLTIIREVLARQGVVNELLGGLEWSARGAMGGQYVSIRPQDGGTRIQVLGNFRDGVLRLGASTGLLGFFGGLIGASVLVLPGVAVAVAAVGIGAAGVWRPGACSSRPPRAR